MILIVLLDTVSFYTTENKNEMQSVQHLDPIPPTGTEVKDVCCFISTPTHLHFAVP
jgi:hypothetical protein